MKKPKPNTWDLLLTGEESKPPKYQEPETEDPPASELLLSLRDVLRKGAKEKREGRDNAESR